MGRTGQPPALGFPDDLRRLASGLAGGDGGSLDLRFSAADITMLQSNRVAAAVARRLRDSRPGNPVGSQLDALLYRAAGKVALLAHTLEMVGEAFARHRIEWAPIKGGDLAFRVYEQPEDRDVGDLDVLIREPDREAAIAALVDSGWVSAQERTALWERYQREEGYCASFCHPNGLMLELHHRLWGAAPSGLPDEVMRDSRGAAELGKTARRAAPEHAFVMAALHAWMVPPRRPISTWWDLQRLTIQDDASLAGDVVTVASRWGLELPVGLAAVASASLWRSEALIAISSSLLARLRPSERILAWWCCKRGTDAVPYWSVVFARLLAGRPSRHGWRSVWRRVLPHPGLQSRGPRM